jgi:type I restriction enzyme, S subunit
MTLDTFFKKFDLFADAPGAVAKMRVLVLQLAVQGKLVSQNPKDEKASILLARIGKTKELLISDRIIRRQETAPIDGTEVPFSIPQSWIWTRLGEIADWGSGSTPSRGNSDLYDGGIAWLKSGELNDNQALAESEETVTEKALTTGSFRRNKPGDVLLAMYGATIGKVAILAEPAVTNQAVCGCTPFDGVFNRYLFSYLLSQRARFHSASEGGAQPNISKVKIVAFPFPLPPLAEQKRIVAKVDELMALCDRLEAQQQARDAQSSALARASLARFAQAPTPANLNLLFHKSYSITPADLRKAILAMAIRGKIVPQILDNKPAVKNIEQNRELVTKVPFEIPNQWSWLHLSQLADINGGFAFKSHDYSERGTRVVRISDFDEVGFKDHKIVRYAFTPDLKKFTLDEGDILMAMTGGTVGKSYYVRSLPEPMIVNQRVATIKVSPEVNPSYIDILIRSEMTQEVIRIAKNSTNDNISMGDIKGFTVPLPPLAEQRRIVAKVDQLMVLVDQLETQLAASRATAKNLLEALVTELTYLH